MIETMTACSGLLIYYSSHVSAKMFINSAFVEFWIPPKKPKTNVVLQNKNINVIFLLRARIKSSSSQNTQQRLLAGPVVYGNLMSSHLH